MSLTADQQSILRIFRQHGMMKMVDLSIAVFQANVNGQIKLEQEASAENIYADIEHLIRLGEIIEIEYPDPSVPNRVKSFLLPGSTGYIRVNGIKRFHARPIENGVELAISTTRS